jgi:hypothetical protein
MLLYHSSYVVLGISCIINPGTISIEDLLATPTHAYYFFQHFLALKTRLSCAELYLELFRVNNRPKSIPERPCSWTVLLLTWSNITPSVKVASVSAVMAQDMCATVHDC